MIESLEIDESGYPSDNTILFIKCLNFDSHEEAKRFMRNDFVRLARELPYATVSSEKLDDDLDGKQMEIVFTTGGWSGCEDFIGAVLGNPILRILFYYQWNRGGRYVFRVPLRET